MKYFNILKRIVILAVFSILSTSCITLLFEFFHRLDETTDAQTGHKLEYYVTNTTDNSILVSKVRETVRETNENNQENKTHSDSTWYNMDAGDTIKMFTTKYDPTLEDISWSAFLKQKPFETIKDILYVRIYTSNRALVKEWEYDFLDKEAVYTGHNFFNESSWEITDEQWTWTESGDFRAEIKWLFEIRSEDFGIYCE